MKTIVALLVGIVSLFCINASAETPNPCSQDMVKFCKNVQPGTPAMMDCLEKHENKLSNACRDYEATMGGARVEMKEEARNKIELRNACKEDISTLCKNVAPEQNGIIKCLSANEKKLSAACMKSVKECKME